MWHWLFILERIINTTLFSYRESKTIVSPCNAAAVPDFFYRPLTIPFVRRVCEVISTCSPRPPLSEGSMELVLYTHRSPDVMEHLFHLAGLIPDRYDITLQNALFYSDDKINTTYVWSPHILIPTCLCILYPSILPTKKAAHAEFLWLSCAQN